ncbi:MAG: ATP-binding cassette domain-containing protein [Paludibacteraceae bacterium]|jgi:phospholipid/cholesterol/gamma-HCH transport system ATP-binding protein|nr:ATP-binding cassette domain-containing protein [Paludibacteraceae bacterium]OPZ02418.1 MAG: L-cystine import ATP-binding protein TcyC [Bacteroidetes bacterium ADurb.BinA395]HON02219.1 ATP-binding cassette domain-containing protein [Paludibacteraceae bacterium]
MIEVKNIIKTFDGVPALQDISAVFETGKVNMIIGQSGSGKTVLMKCIIGLHQIDSGCIEYDGRNLPKMKPQEILMLRREVGMLFQGAALFDSMTVLENVMYPLEMFAHESNEEIRERAYFCLRRVNLEERSYDLYPSEISGGMQKRVGIARAIALRPKYLFCDEPNSGLDPLTSMIIDDLIYEITHEFNITTIINSHDMNSVMEIGEKIIYIEKGVKAWEGTKDEIFDAENESFNNFVFASKLFKQLKMLKQNPY